MNNFIKYFLFGLAFVSVGLLLGFRINDNSTQVESVSLDEGLQKFQETLYFIERNYVKEPNNGKLVDDAIKGMLEGLDPHSFYISSTEMKQMEEQMTGGYDGIGIEFSILDDTLYVVTPLAGGPSEKLGVQAGDRIIEVDGTNVAGIGLTNTDVYTHLKGPKGSKVILGILRRGASDLMSFEIERDRIPLHSVPYSYMIDDEIGYIQISRFSDKTYREFSDHLKQLEEKGMKHLVLDLRGNPGGYLEKAYQIADEFLQAGKVIVSTNGRTRESQETYKSTATFGDFEKGGLAVLIDYGSASASEIVSGAVQDHDRGLILGVRSFGKGLVQLQKKFRDGSAIRVVVSQYYTPSGRCIQKPYDKSSEEYQKEIEERFESGEIYDASKINFPDSLKFKTGAGRTVYGGGGIFPDVFVAPDTSGSSRYFAKLTSKDLFRGFAYSYADEHPDLIRRYPRSDSYVRGFDVSPQMVAQFKMYTADHGVPVDSDGFRRSERYIINRIKAYVGRKLYQDDGFYPVYHQLDNVLSRAVALMPKAERLYRTGELVID